MDILKFLSDNIYLVILAAVSGGMLVWPMLRGSLGGGSSLNTLQATQMINQQDALMLDVRDAVAFAEGHILNARNIPLAQLDARAGDLGKQKDKARPIIVHCETGARSSGAVAILNKQGFEKVFTLAGGLAAWKQAGLPTEK